MKYWLSLTLFCASFLSFSQGTSFNKIYDSNGVDNGYSVEVDSQDNLIFCGVFSDSIVVNPADSSNPFLQGGGVSGSYLVKLDSSGTHQWSKNLSGTDEGVMNDVAADSDNSVYVVGDFEGSLSIDASTTLVDAISANRGCLIKYDSAGNYLWSRQYGFSRGEVKEVHVTQQDVIIISGITINGVNLNPNGTAENVSLGVNSRAAFVIALDKNGNKLWSKVFAKSDLTTVGAVGLEGYGNDAYLMISFRGDIGEYPNLSQYQTPTPNDLDGLIIKVDGYTGNQLWSKHFSGRLDQSIHGAHVGPLGNLYVGGIIDTTTDFNQGGVPYVINTSQAANYLLKIFPNGQLDWLNYDSPSSALAYPSYVPMGHAPDGSILISNRGRIGFDIDLSPNTNTTVASGSFYYLQFISRISTDGNLLEYWKLGDISPTLWQAPYVRDLAVKSNSDIVLVGSCYQGNEVNIDTALSSVGNVSSSASFLSSGYQCSPDVQMYELFDCDTVVFQGQSYTQSTTIEQRGATACDSVVLAQINIHLDRSVTESITTCDSLVLADTVLYSSGTYVFPHTDVNGCDSSYTLNLSVSISNARDATGYLYFCDSISFDGHWFTQDTVYRTTSPDIFGCDSLYTAHITQFPSRDSVVSTPFVGCDSVVVSGAVYKTSGNYLNLSTDIFGCDSTFSFDVIINANRDSIVSLSSCDSLEYGGTMYYQSFSSLFNGTDVNGCDSTYSLDIQIHPSFDSTYTLMACDSILVLGSWYSQDAQIDTSFTTPYGCDSTYSLTLQISTSFDTVIDVFACDSVFILGDWYLDNTQFDTILPTSTGCDSTIHYNIEVVRLDLALTFFADSMELWVAQSGANYQWYTCGNDTAVLIPGATDQIIQVYQWGSYFVVVDSAGCVDTSECVLIQLETVEELSANAFIVYPNPTSDVIHVEFTAIQREVDLNLYDVQGKLMYTVTESETEKVALSLTQLPSGVYFLEVIDVDGLTQRKRIVKR